MKSQVIFLQQRNKNDSDSSHCLSTNKFNTHSSSIRFNSNQNIQPKDHLQEKVWVYVKPTSAQHKFGYKLYLNKFCQLSDLQINIQQKTQISIQNQVIYLDGQKITSQSSDFSNIIKLYEKCILYTSNLQQISLIPRELQIRVRFLFPSSLNLLPKNQVFKINTREYVKNLIETIFTGVLESYKTTHQLRLIKSGRVLSETMAWRDAELLTTTQLIGLLSERQVQVQFERQEPIPSVNNENRQPQMQQEPLVRAEESSKQFDSQQNDSEVVQTDLQYSPISRTNHNVSQNNDYQFPQPLNFKKKLPPLSTTNFMVKKPKETPLYTQISSSIKNRSAGYNYTENQKIYQNYSHQGSTSNPSYSQLSLDSFKKKKKTFYEDHQSDQEIDQSNQNQKVLLKKIKVHKSKKQLDKLLSQNSLIKETNIEQSEAKSVVSSSSSQGEGPLYLRLPSSSPSEHKPVPQIPSRKLLISQKIKINMELQKLFGNGNSGNLQNKQNNNDKTKKISNRYANVDQNEQ